MTQEEWDNLSSELQTLGVLNGVQARSFQESLRIDRSRGLTDRQIVDDWFVACIEKRGGLRRVEIKDFSIRFVPIEQGAV